jgi:hypothetical protein
MLTHVHSCKHCNTTWSCTVDECIHEREVRPAHGWHYCVEYLRRIEALKALQRRNAATCKHKCTPECQHAKIDVQGPTAIGSPLTHDERTRLASGHGNMAARVRTTAHCVTCTHILEAHDETDHCMIWKCTCTHFVES